MNKYQNWHDSIIKKARDRNWTDRKEVSFYIEKHHIIPRCLGGINRKENLVFLTAKEHYLVHLLLVKINKDNPDGKIRKSLYAAYKVVAGTYINDGENYQKPKRTSRMYERFRKEISEFYTGENNPMFGKKQSDKQKDAIRKAMTGKKDRPETTEKRRQNGLGRHPSEESKEKNRIWHLGRKMSPEAIEKTRQANLGRKQTEKQKASVSRKYTVKFPDGRKEEIQNLSHFCRNHGIPISCQSSLTGNGYRGYQAWRI